MWDDYNSLKPSVYYNGEWHKLEIKDELLVRVKFTCSFCLSFAKAKLDMSLNLTEGLFFLIFFDIHYSLL